MHPSDLQPLVRHMEWADALVWNAVLALPAAHSDPLTRERLHHVHMVQWAYLGIWREERLDLPELSTFADLPAIRAWGRGFYPRAADVLASLDEGALRRHVTFPWAAEIEQHLGSFHPATLAESVLQVTSHTTYHRGQVNARLRELGGEPPLVDLVAWIWMGKPDPAWEAAEAPASTPRAGET